MIIMSAVKNSEGVDVTPYLKYVILAMIAIFILYNAGVAIGKFIYHIKH